MRSKLRRQSTTFKSPLIIRRYYPDHSQRTRTIGISISLALMASSAQNPDVFQHLGVASICAKRSNVTPFIGTEYAPESALKRWGQRCNVLSRSSRRNSSAGAYGLRPSSLPHETFAQSEAAQLDQDGLPLLRKCRLFDSGILQLHTWPGIKNRTRLIFYTAGPASSTRLRCGARPPPSLFALRLRLCCDGSPPSSARLCWRRAGCIPAPRCGHLGEAL